MILAQARTVFLHGIGGSGMRGLAWLLYKNGKNVRGTDTVLPNDLPHTFQVASEENAQELLAGIDVYIYSDAVDQQNTVRQAVQTQSIPSLSYQAAVGEFAAPYTTVAIAGTHGKSSTTAFLGHILIEAGRDPTVLVGATVPGWEGMNARFGSTLFVVEADEYRNHFHTLRPTHIVIPSVEFDHPDFFRSLIDVVASFQLFIDRLPPNGSLIIPKSLADKKLLSLPKNTTIVSAENLPPTPIPGQHMQSNAALAVAAAEQLGVPRKKALAYLTSFPGLGRRFEILGTIGTATVISDYGHHPTEITATLLAARKRYPNQKIAIIFEAHTAERLVAFKERFADVLSQADGVILYPPYLPKGRSVASGKRAYQNLQKLLLEKGTSLEVLAARDQLPAAVTRASATFDIILACSAGVLDQDLRDAIERWTEIQG